MSGFADERQAIENRFAANWTTTSIKWDNVPFPEMASSYVALSILTGGGERITIGNSNPRHRWAGVISIKILTPEDSGNAVARVYADTIAGIFRDAQFSAGTNCTITCGTPAIKPGAVVDGWYVINVVVPYRRDKQI